MFEKYNKLVTKSKGEFGSGSDALSVALRDLQNYIGVGNSFLDQLMNASMARLTEELSGLSEIGRYYKALFEQVGQAAQGQGEPSIGCCLCVTSGCKDTACLPIMSLGIDCLDSPWLLAVDFIDFMAH